MRDSAWIWNGLLLQEQLVVFLVYQGTSPSLAIFLHILACMHFCR